MNEARTQLSNFCSTLGWGLLAAISVGIVVGLVNEELYLILLFPAIMGYLVGRAAEKGIRTFMAPALIVMVSTILSVSTYATILCVDYQLFRHELASVVDARTTAELREQGRSIEEIHGFMDGQDYKRTRRHVVDAAIRAEIGYSGVVGYVVSRVRTGDEIGLAISRHTTNVGSAGTVVLWIVDIIVMAVVIGICIP